MRLRWLDLRAFGPFTGRRIEFREGAPALHVVHGANEAGKSTSLRALSALLFGVPERTLDAHVHAGPALRVGGAVSLDGGEDLEFYRRKGRRRTLIDAHDAPLEAPAARLLEAALEGVDANRFAQVFGLDHDALVAGGEALLAEHGEEARALFGSALGTHSVSAVLAEFEDDARATYLARGRDQHVNGRLRELKGLREREASLSLAAEDYDTAHRALAETEAALAEAEGELKAQRAELARIERIQRARPGVARVRDLRERLDAFADLVELPADFAARHHEAAHALARAAEALARDGARLADIDTALEALPETDALLADADAVEALREGAIRERDRDVARPALDASLAAAGARVDEARAALESLSTGSAARTLDDVDNVLPELHARLAQRRSIQRSATQGGTLRKDLARAHEELQATERELAALQEQHAGEVHEPASRDGAAELRATRRSAVAAARAAGDLDADIDARSEALARELDACAQAAARLVGAQTDAKSFAALALPGMETVNRFAAEAGEHDVVRRQLAERASDCRERLRAGVETLAGIDRDGAVPSEADLAAARTHRDAGWQLLRRQWLDGQDVAGAASKYAPSQSLADAFERAVGDADAVADALRAAGERVLRRARTEHDVDSARAALDATEVELQQAQARSADFEGRWRDVWTPSGIEPGTPTEMREWLGEAARLRERIEAASASRSQLHERERLRERLLARLGESAGLVEPALPGTLLATVLGAAEARLAADEARAHEVEAREARIADKASERDGRRGARDAAQAAFDDWLAAWQARLAELGVGATSDVEAVMDYFEAVQRLAEALTTEDALRTELDAAEAASAEFAQDAESLASRLASLLPTPGAAQSGALATSATLHSLLADARSAAARRAALDKEREPLRTSERAARSALARAGAELDALGALAGGAPRDALAGIAERSSERAELRKSLLAAETSLVEVGDGHDVETLEREAISADPDTLAGECERLRTTVESSLEPRWKALVERRVEARAALDAMHGSAEAQHLAEEAQGIEAELTTLVHRYARSRLAARILRGAIERYRADNRDPILARAGEYFALLTRARYAGIRTSFDAKDNAILMAVRADGEAIDMAGLSTGTRDQLYLSLRLATLERFGERGESLPFVVDDVLVHFDESRSAAAFEALAAFAVKTQVIVFTHHAHIAAQARETVNADLIELT